MRSLILIQCRDLRIGVTWQSSTEYWQPNLYN